MSTCQSLDDDPTPPTQRFHVTIARPDGTTERQTVHAAEGDFLGLEVEGADGGSWLLFSLTDGEPTLPSLVGTWAITVTEAS